jgi:lactoylglutathione lyase
MGTVNRTWHVFVAALAAASISSPAMAQKSDVRVSGPVSGGNGSWIGSGQMTTAQLAAVHYVEAEYFVDGTATSYEPVSGLSPDGMWTVRAAGSAHFNTRVLVRRPASARDFNGVVVVEWNNVTGGNDGGVDFNYMKEEILRGGYAWIGVSAQAAGVTRLRNEDAARYGSLEHPGDPYSYDIFTIASRIVRTPVGLDVLRRPDGQQDIRSDVKKVVAIGRSQSAGRLVTYINAVQPLTKMHDGFLVHSRGRSAAGLTPSAPGQPGVAGQGMPADVRIRADVSVPVLVVQAEGDVQGSFGSRQPPSAHYRRWEIAGTSHAGIRESSETARYVVEVPPPLPTAECRAPINVAPHNAVTKAALHALAQWVQKGAAPPQSPDIDIDAGQSDPIVRDRFGLATGGIRLPEVEAPTATVDGRMNQPANTVPGQQNFCALFGTTTPFDAATLTSLYPSHEAFVSRFKQAVAAVVKQGYWLQPEADEAIRAADASSIGRGSSTPQSGAALPSNRIINTTLNVADLDHALVFFTRGLGMHEKNRRVAGPGVTELSIGYSDEAGIPELMLVHSTRQGSGASRTESAQPPSPASADWGHVILQVKDVKTVCDRVAASGGKVIRAPAETASAPVIVAFVQDPDGHRFELVQFK